MDGAVCWLGAGEEEDKLWCVEGLGGLGADASAGRTLMPWLGPPPVLVSGRNWLSADG